MCIEYRESNKVTLKNKCPLPMIDDVFDHLHGACHFSKIDLWSIYHQVQVSEHYVPRTTFTIHYGHYNFLVMLFMDLMNRVCRPFLDKSVIVFIDDILVYSCNREDHRRNLWEVLDTFPMEKLHAKCSKCEIWLKEVQFLVHVVGSKGIYVDPVTNEAVKEWPK